MLVGLGFSEVSFVCTEGSWDIPVLLFALLLCYSDALNFVVCVFTVLLCIPNLFRQRPMSKCPNL